MSRNKRKLTVIVLAGNSSTKLYVSEHSEGSDEEAVYLLGVRVKMTFLMFRRGGGREGLSVGTIRVVHLKDVACLERWLIADFLPKVLNAVSPSAIDPQVVEVAAKAIVAEIAPSTSTRRSTSQQGTFWKSGLIYPFSLN